jgi:hypothetical protein
MGGYGFAQPALPRFRSNSRARRTIDQRRERLDKSRLCNYLYHMNIVRRTLDIDSDTDARLREMAEERGQNVAAVLAEAVALLDSVVDIAGPDIAEDRRRLDAFKRTAPPSPSMR